MRVLIDALGAPEMSGGMRLYAEELIRAWSELGTDDELHVVGYPWATRAFENLPVTVHAVPERTMYRVAGQWVYTPVAARRLKAHVVISVSLVVSPLAGRVPRLCVVHDWRHLKNPDEFKRLQRLYRRSWTWSVENADAAIQISSKTMVETSRFAPGAHGVVVPNGGDHARRWPRRDRVQDGRRFVVTFGHQSNKRPELVIGALAHLPEHVVAVVLGARGQYADELLARAEGLGVASRVTFPGFVDEAEYQRLIQTADAVALVSTDEGYGLPVAEANYFGIPVVAAEDSGLDEIHPGRVISVPAEVEALAKALLASFEGPAGTEEALVQEWSETAVAIRGTALSLLTGARA
jgi:glycosyltransferase involved in cell wall biosynthesis